jgi:hypothetical protein
MKIANNKSETTLKTKRWNGSNVDEIDSINEKGQINGCHDEGNGHNVGR